MIIAASAALAVEGVVGAVVMLRDFGPELGSTLTLSQTGTPFWVFAWEGVQVLVAISLVFVALLVLRGSRPGLVTALVLQLAAIAVSGYRVADTLPDSPGLILFVAVTTVLLSTKSVRDWCLGRSDRAFQRLIADHPSPTTGLPPHPAPDDGRCPVPVQRVGAAVMTTPDADDVRHAPEHPSQAIPPWTVLASSLAVAAQAVVIAEHARRLFAGIVASEETLGLAALGPLDREVPAAVLEGFVALGLLIAAVAVVRRSRLALAYAEIVQAVVLAEVVLRVAGGLALPPTVVLFALAAVIASLLAAPATRRWCDVPIRPRMPDKGRETIR